MAEALPARPREQRRVAVKRALVSVGIVVISAAILIGVWLFLVHVVGVSQTTIPAPGDVFDKLRDGLQGKAHTVGSIGGSDYVTPTVETVRATALGFVYGAVFGLILGTLMAQWRWFHRIVVPYLTGFQSLPKVALAPLFVIWFGFGDFSREMMAAALVFFPVAVSTLNGLQAVSADRLEMARSYGGGPWRTLIHVRLPAASASIFTGLELGVVYALLGAIAAELVAGNSGIGAMLTSQQATNDTAGMFAILIISGVVGGLMFGIIRVLRKRIVFWEGHAQ